MPSAAEEASRNVLRELEFIKLLDQYLPKAIGAKIIPEPRLKGGKRPDFLAIFPTGIEAIVEAKGATPSTQTRLRQVVQQLNGYADAYLETFPGKARPEIMLAVPGIFSPQHHDFLMASGLAAVIDGPTLCAAGADPDLLGLAGPPGAQPQGMQARARELLERLDSVPPGRPHWSEYQTLCGHILEFLLSPPLSSPLRERSNSSKVNRRDFVLPNYATAGFWDYMRAYYSAHYIVVDAKNYRGNVKKGEVLQVANYLSEHGAGLFGMIICRNGGDRSAGITRQEQWAIYRKMIIVVNDDDLRQMISNMISGTNPSDVIRQKLEDFRLDF